MTYKMIITGEWLIYRIVILEGAWTHYNMKRDHIWAKSIDNENPAFGRLEHIQSIHKFNSHESEEYTQAIAATLFSHVWILSAANYYRLSCKLKTQSSEQWSYDKIVNKTHSPSAIAKQLNLPDHVIACGKGLHEMRNTIMHLVEGDSKTAAIHELGFKTAYMYAKSTWIIYCALLRNYGQKPAGGSWRMQTERFSLPTNLKDCDI